MSAGHGNWVSKI